MRVSRELDYSRINEYDIENRFFKLPITNFLEIEDILPNNPQIAIINAVNDPRFRFITACISRRVGKSFIAYRLGFLKALEPNTSILIVAPNYSLANIGWESIKKLINKYGLETTKENAKDKEIYLSNGSLIKLASAVQPDSAVGRSYDLIIFDEAAIAREGEDAFNIQLRPTLDKENSKVLFISTPRGSNWFKTFFERGFSAEDVRWISIHATYRDNPRVDLADIEEARRTVSSSYFKQEYEAEFSTFEGQIYEAFAFEKHVKDLSRLNIGDPRDVEVIMGVDVGYRDPTAALLVKYNIDEDHFYILNEYERAQATTAQHAAKFQEWIDKYDVDRILVDSAAAQFRRDLVSEFDIPSSPAKKSVLDGIAYVQMLFEQDKITVDESCTNLILAISNYRWEMSDSKSITKEKPVHDKYSHLMDALRYAIYSIAR